MTRQEVDQIRQDIKDKAVDFLIRQIEIVIRTVPSTKFPNGAKYQGYVFDVKDNKIVLSDTVVNKRIDIFISEIASPADLWEYQNG